MSRIEGRSDRLPKPNTSRNSRLVPKRKGLPITSFLPTTRMSRRSISVFSEPAQSTPRICSISRRVTGCLYAMIESVSSAAREKRGGFTSNSRRTYSWLAGFVRNWIPLATSSTSTPDDSGGYLACRIRITSRTEDLESPPRTCPAFSRESGCSETRSRLSRMDAARERSSAPGCASPVTGGGVCPGATVSSRVVSRAVGFFGLSSIFHLAHRRDDADESHRVGLVNLDGPEPDQFKDPQEERKDLVFRPELLDQAVEPDRAFFPDPVQKKRDRVRDREPVHEYLVRLVLRHPVEDVLEGRDQVRQGKFGDDHFVAGDFLAQEIPGEHVTAQDRPFGEPGRRLLEFLVFNEAPGKLGAHLLRVLLGFRLLARPRQQRLRFHVQEGRRHDEEFARNVQVQRLHRVEIGQVLLRDPRDRDVMDIELVLADQVQQEVERPLEDLEADRDPRSRVGRFRSQALPGPPSSSFPRSRAPAPSPRQGSAAPGYRFPRSVSAARGWARAPSPCARASTSCTRCTRSPPCGNPRRPSGWSPRRKRSCGRRRRCRSPGCPDRRGAPAPGR